MKMIVTESKSKRVKKKDKKAAPKQNSNDELPSASTAAAASAVASFASSQSAEADQELGMGSLPGIPANAGLSPSTNQVMAQAYFQQIAGSLGQPQGGATLPSAHSQRLAQLMAVQRLTQNPPLVNQQQPMLLSSLRALQGGANVTGRSSPPTLQSMQLALAQQQLRQQQQQQQQMVLDFLASLRRSPP